jgi:hypothetical protein
MASNRNILRGHDSRPSDEYVASIGGDRTAHATLTLGGLGAMSDDLAKAQSTLSTLAAAVEAMHARLDRLGAPR